MFEIMQPPVPQPVDMDLYGATIQAKLETLVDPKGEYVEQFELANGYYAFVAHDGSGKFATWSRDPGMHVDSEGITGWITPAEIIEHMKEYAQRVYVEKEY